MLDVGTDMRKIKHCFNYIKQLINRTNIPDRSLLSPDITGAEDTPEKKEELKKLKDLLHQRDNEINILVNMLKKEKKKAQDALFQLSAGSSGLAVSKSSLSISFEEGHRSSACVNVKDTQDFSSSVHRAAFLPRQAGSRGEMSLGRQEAFEIFKRDHVDSVTIDDNKQLLKQKFAEAKSLGEKVNELRNKINHLKGEITQRHMQRAALGVANPEELNESDPKEEKLRAQIEEEKKSYKTMFNHLKGLKIEIEHLQFLMEKAKVKLQKDFEIWWSEEASNLQNQQEKPPTSNSASALRASPQVLESQQDLYNNSSSDPGRKNNVSSLSNSASSTRTPRTSSTSIPLTGDSQTDADILAFIKARQNIMQRKGLGNK